MALKKCTLCGKEFFTEMKRRTHCYMCMEPRQHAESEKKETPSTKHKCVDCGTPTSNRRCGKCLTVWRVRHGVPMDVSGVA